jgi:hypothetical protein
MMVDETPMHLLIWFVAFYGSIIGLALGLSWMINTIIRKISEWIENRK